MDPISFGKLVVTPKHIPVRADEPTFKKPDTSMSGSEILLPRPDFDAIALEEAVEARDKHYHFMWDCNTQQGTPRPFGFFGTFPPILEFLPMVNTGDFPHPAKTEDKKKAVLDLFDQVKKDSGFAHAKAMDDASIKMFGNTHVSLPLDQEISKLDKMNSYYIYTTLRYEGFVLVPKPAKDGPKAALILLLPSHVELSMSKTGTCHEKEDKEVEEKPNPEGTDTPKPVLDKRILLQSTEKEATKLRKGWRRDRMDEMKREREALRKREKSAAEQIDALGE